MISLDENTGTCQRCSKGTPAKIWHKQCAACWQKRVLEAGETAEHIAIVCKYCEQCVTVTRGAKACGECSDYIPRLRNNKLRDHEIIPGYELVVRQIQKIHYGEEITTVHPLPKLLTRECFDDQDELIRGLWLFKRPSSYIAARSPLPWIRVSYEVMSASIRKTKQPLRDRIWPEAS